jgi:hypothetical protein
MRSLAGIWSGIAVTFGGMSWDAQWHAGGNAHGGTPPPPHFLLLAGLALLTISSWRGAGRAEGRVQDYLRAVAIAGGVGLTGQVGDELLHMLGVESALVGLAHLAATLGFLVATISAVVASIGMLRSEIGGSTA